MAKTVLLNRGMARQAKVWTTREIDELIELYARGFRWGVIAQHLGRSVPSVYNRLQTLRLYYRLPATVWANKSSSLTDPKLALKGRR